MMVNAMVNDTTLSIIESLYPDFNEYANNERFFHWMDYACELDVLLATAYAEESDFGIGLVEMLNSKIKGLRAGSAEHDACVDVASTLEESLPTHFKGKFKYE